MAPEAGATLRRVAAALLVVTGCSAASSIAHAQQPNAASRGALSCTNAAGQLTLSDKPSADCVGRDQTRRGSDGAIRAVIPPTRSLHEQTLEDQRQREADAILAARNDAVRRDRNLLARYPDEAAHRKARDAALGEKRKSIEIAEKRLATLTAERKPLEEERQFYPGKKQLPFKLRLALDGNDATVAGTKDAIANQQAEIVRINATFEDELVRLKKLWAGARLGSLGPTPTKSPAR